MKIKCGCGEVFETKHAEEHDIEEDSGVICPDCGEWIWENDFFDRATSEIMRGECSCGEKAYITVIQWIDVRRVFHLCLEHGQGRLLDDVEELMEEED